MASSTSNNSFSYYPKVLVVELRGELIGVDFKKLLRSNLVANAAPIHFEMNLVRERGLVGLKHATLGSNVHLLGGEKLKREATPKMTYLSQHWDSYLGSSNQVLDLHSKGKSLKVEHSRTIPPMNHPKGSPLVAQIEGKIYVLQGKPYLHSLDPFPATTFEVYNPANGTWEVLPALPPCTNNHHVFGHFVLGRKLFIITESMKIYFFDSHTRQWERSAMVETSFEQTDLFRIPPTNIISVPFFPQLSDDKFQLMLSPDKMGAQVCALIVNPSTGVLLCYQRLREVFSRLRSVADTLTMQSQFFFVLPNTDICAVWAGCDQHERLRLFISIFTLGLCCHSMQDHFPIDIICSTPPPPPVMMTFLEVNILHEHECTVAKDEACSNYVNDAFLLYEK